MSPLRFSTLAVLLAAVLPTTGLDGLQWSAVLDVRAGALDGRVRSGRNG